MCDQKKIDGYNRAMEKQNKAATELISVLRSKLAVAKRAQSEEAEEAEEAFEEVSKIAVAYVANGSS